MKSLDIMLLHSPTAGKLLLFRKRCEAIYEDNTDFYRLILLDLVFYILSDAGLYYVIDFGFFILVILEIFEYILLNKERLEEYLDLASIILKELQE